MDTNALPTTVLAVDANLRERATPDMKDNPHYLLGMCEALLAEANREILKLRLERARQRVGGGSR